ncbi:MAG: ATP-binding cassette domain-containing protein [Gammaproteobacteria bacterium]|nr:ATP-binding cassette domain-containing protein [Gammaproteobacteria bacterium]
MIEPDPRARASSRDLRPLRQALPFLRPYIATLLLALLCLCIAAGAMLGMPVAIRYVIDYGFAGENGGNIDRYFEALLALAAVFAFFAGMRYYLVMWIGERVVADIRNAVYRHVIQLSPTFFEVTRSGEVLSRLTADTTLVQSMVGAGVSIALRSSIMLLGGLVMLFVTSAKLAGLILVLVPLVVLPILIYGRRVRRLSRVSQDRVADSSGVAGEVLNAIGVVQAFTLEEFQARRFSDAVERAFLAARQRLRTSALLSGLIVLTSFGAIVVVLWVGARSVAGGGVSAGTLSQFLLYATLVAGSTTALGEVWSDVQRAAGAMERLMELLSAQPTIRAPDKPVPLPVPGRGSIRMEAVTFHYPSRPGQLALDRITLDVKPGETVALVGPSGAGKSTVFQLLLRFYDPQQGKVLVDGVDVALADPRVVRGRIGIVPQHTVLFAADVMENIRYGRPHASDDEVKSAAVAAVADEFIAGLPEGYKSFLGERGARLSGGQQQRIAIARAILKDPPILLLDEATSALDNASERLVQQALRNLMRHRTTIIIAHRLSTVQQADRIVVMDNGRIIDEGRHDVLMARDSLYARLAQARFGEEQRAENEVPEAV